jgi:hypothetical protein
MEQLTVMGLLLRDGRESMDEASQNSSEKLLVQDCRTIMGLFWLELSHFMMKLVLKLVF